MLKMHNIAASPRWQTLVRILCETMITVSFVADVNEHMRGISPQFTSQFQQKIFRKIPPNSFCYF